MRQRPLAAARADQEGAELLISLHSVSKQITQTRETDHDKHAMSNFLCYRVLHFVVGFPSVLPFADWSLACMRHQARRILVAEGIKSPAVAFECDIIRESSC
jgi:hypothetical protein